MLSIQMLRLIVDERERDIQRELRIRRLLGRYGESDVPANDAAPATYRESWRASTPRARATTR